MQSETVAKKQHEIYDLCSRFSDLVLAGKAELAYLGLIELAHDGPRGAGLPKAELAFLFATALAVRNGSKETA